jgi:acetyl-CoA synthetase
MGLMLGYQDDWGKTIEAGDGVWYRTGDVARRDADGYYHYVGRADDLFKSAEYRISPFELESVLLQHEAVTAAAVVPSAEPDGLVVPKAVIELDDGFVAGDALAEEVLRFTRARLAPYQRIRRVEFADLPKTMTGKIRRVELRQREENLRSQGKRAASEFWEEDFPTLVEEA